MSEQPRFRILGMPEPIRLEDTVETSDAATPPDESGHHQLDSVFRDSTGS